MRWTSGLLLALILAPNAGAQGTPDFSGTWVLQIDKSDFGPMPAPQSRTDVIEHKGATLTIRRSAVSPLGLIEATLTYGIDGKPYTNTAGPTTTTSRLKWEGQVLVMEGTLSTAQGDAAFVDRWSLSADGKTLTQARTINVGGDQVVQTLVMAKKP